MSDIEAINKRLLSELKFSLECLTLEPDSWKRYWYDEEPYSNIARAIQDAEGIHPKPPNYESNANDQVDLEAIELLMDVSLSVE